jgi:hypothetical protein
MEPDDINAKFSQPAGDFFAVGMGREISCAIKVGSPEAARCTVFKDELAIANLKKAMSSRGFFIGKNEREIDGSIIPREGIGDGTAGGSLHDEILFAEYFAAQTMAKSSLKIKRDISYW